MTRKQKRLVKEGDLVAEVEVEMTGDDQPWGPYLTLEDAQRLDAVRSALERNDVAAAVQLGRVFRLMPLTAS
jgi:hypothetical protein